MTISRFLSWALAAVSILSAVARGTGLPEIHAPAAVAIASPQIIVPGMANSPGAASSYWLSDVHITNHNADPSNLTLCYAANTAPGAPTCVQKSVASGVTVALDDVVLKTFNMPGSFGALFLDADNNVARSKLIEVGSETYNLDRNTGGTLGIGVKPLRPIQSGDILNIFGPTDTTKFRSNLARGTLNDSVTFWWRLHDNNDILIAEKHETLGPYEVRQTPLFDFFDVPPRPEMFVELVGETGTNGFAYATVIDNTSNSGTYHPPLLKSVAGGPNLAPTSSFIISNAKSAGAYGSFWASDLILRNTNSSNIADVEIDYLQTGRDNAGPANFIWQRFVNGETRHYSDVLGDLLQLSPPAVGALHFQPAPVFAQGRTFTTREDGGTIGASLPQMSKYDGAIARNGFGADAQVVTDVDINGIYDNQDPAKGILRRTNVIALNTSTNDDNGNPKPATGTITLYDSTGKQIGTPVPVSLAPYEHQQWNGLARTIAGGDVINARLRLHLDNQIDLYRGIHPSALLLATTVNNISNNSTAR